MRLEDEAVHEKAPPWPQTACGLNTLEGWDMTAVRALTLFCPSWLPVTTSPSWAEFCAEHSGQVHGLQNDKTRWHHTKPLARIYQILYPKLTSTSLLVLRGWRWQAGQAGRPLPRSQAQAAPIICCCHQLISTKSLPGFIW